MSPPRRRSARLATAAVKSKATPDLSSVAERAESPEPTSKQSLDEIVTSPARPPATPVSARVKPPVEEMHPSKAQTTTEYLTRQPATPASAKPKPPREEMHPSKVHPTTTEAPSRAVATPASKLKQPRPTKQTKVQQILNESSMQPPATPASVRIKPPHDEMHPSKAHPTTAEPSSALRLGFSDIKPTTNNGAKAIADQQKTPTKVGSLPSSSFTFQFTRPGAEGELSSNAQRMMTELREQANKYKADLVAQREAEGGNERKIAMPKGKSGRYSSAHMAEFKKMDSIEGHPSAWRAQNGRFTPVISGLKRTRSKADLQTTPTSQSKITLGRSPSKAGAEQPPATPRLKPGLKRSSSRANLDQYQQSPSPKKMAPAASTSKPRMLGSLQQPSMSTAKRAKKTHDDDTSSGRPTSRDGTSIPQPKSTITRSGKLPQSQSSLARLMSPTKSSLNHVGTPSKSNASVAKSSSTNSLGGLTKSATTQDLDTAAAATPRRIISPNRFQRIRSILRGQKTMPGSAQSAIPQPFTSQTPAPRKIEKALPPAPLTTPRRKLTKHVAFSPRLELFPSAQDTLSPQGSPSPQKNATANPIADHEHEDVQYPSLDGILSDNQSDDVVYPDLSAMRPLPQPPSKDDRALQPSAPGSFTFRSDHTIEFGSKSPTGFGASPGQSSVRHVRDSMMSKSTMPGSFPVPPSPSTHSNKENKAPAVNRVLTGAPHGMSSKKRRRASWDEDDFEKDTQGHNAKKLKKDPVAEGQALLAPRLMSKTPATSVKKAPAPRSIGRPIPASASPTKKRAFLSMSRLNMLARPKNRQ